MGFDPRPVSAAHRTWSSGVPSRFLNPGRVASLPPDELPAVRRSQPSSAADRPSRRAREARARVPSRSSAAPWRLGARLGSAPAADSDRAARAVCAPTGLPDEIRVIRVRKSIRLGSQPPRRARSSSESTVSQPCDRKEGSIASQLFAYAAEWDSRSITRMRTPTADATLGAALRAARPHLEVASGRSASPPPRNAPRRPIDSRDGPPHGRAAGRAAALRGSGRPPMATRSREGPFYEQLRARPAVERMASIRANLGVDTKRSQYGERAPRPPTRRRRGGTKADAAEQVHRPRRVKQRGELREPVAAAFGCESRELRARVRRERRCAHRSVPSSASSRRRFRRWPEGP